MPDRQYKVTVSEDGEIKSTQEMKPESFSSRMMGNVLGNDSPLERVITALTRDRDDDDD